VSEAFNPEPLPGERHPQGRRCGDPKLLMLAVLLLPYALLRMAADGARGQRFTDEGWRIDSCRSCDADIVWASTGGGKAMPVDVALADDGNVELTRTNGHRGPTATVLTGPSLFPVPLRKAHFVTCPQASEWRR
jgi:hypothetical protein